MKVSYAPLATNWQLGPHQPEVKRAQRGILLPLGPQSPSKLGIPGFLWGPSQAPTRPGKSHPGTDAQGRYQPSKANSMSPPGGGGGHWAPALLWLSWSPSAPGVSLPKGGGGGMRVGGSSPLDQPFLALGDLVGQPCGRGLPIHRALALARRSGSTCQAWREGACGPCFFSCPSATG